MLKKMAAGIAGVAVAALCTVAVAGSISGAGATFPAPVYQKWAETYKATSGNELNYQAIGSGGGIKNITAKSVDFGASDAPMTNAELAAAPGIIHLPTVAGAVTVAYNVPGLGPGVALTGPVIADIFLGKITKWNDPAIAKLNPGVKFPSTAIEPFHRSDGSGTTNAFPTYLSEVSGAWKS
ncbi:MAG TPA: phosphate ABC transporter substrate-binding protein PstS, partial [Caulobacteraceae bacterium]